ncbi:MAG: tryptophan-rich sensory protein [Methanospirillum sp.]|uniref:TspO/MBR family protein n=1 Tax=Methanospirillum sp. TaxID=45200 RepID=UPI00236D6493|nr:TspO/MBR family protein [Methanospirillum sp.]MDD1727560.1 tryptophan-rich sensory protein [Methanospirillum sp.]
MKHLTIRSCVLLIGCIFLPIMVGVIGSLVTLSSVSTWYASLIKPVFAPPNWLFGPVWTLLYILMGISLWLIIRNGIEDQTVRKGFIIFIAQLLVNLFWSLAFFGMQSPVMGFITIIILVILIVFTIRTFKTISLPAAYLLIPYLCWTCIATVLNLSILLLNHP